MIVPGVQERLPPALGDGVMVNCRGAEQLASSLVIVTTEPLQVQLKLLAAAVTALAVPLAQRLAVGAFTVATPLALPQEPTVVGAKVAVTVHEAVATPVVKLFTPTPVAVPLQPLMLCVV